MVNIFIIIVKFCGIYNSFSKKSKAELIIKDKFRRLTNILFTSTAYFYSKDALTDTESLSP